jgi:zona occludens toxin (predicted ATPase)
MARSAKQLQVTTKRTKRFVRPTKLRALRKVLIGVGVLVLVAIVAGFIYTWYIGLHTAHHTASTATSTAPVLSKPTAPAANAPESAAVESITSPVAPGSNALIYIQTLPFSTCTITAVYNKVPSTDSGLRQKTADDYGIVSWSWTVDASAPVGSWPVTVTCVYHAKSAVVAGTLVVANP